MSNGTIVVDADNGAVDTANKKTQEGFKKTANEAQKVAVGIDAWGKSLAARLVGIGAIIGALKAVDSELKNQRAEAVATQRGRGSAALAREATARQLDISSETLGTVMKSGGAASFEERQAGVLALGQAAKGARRKPQRSETFQAIGLINSGVFSQDEVIEAYQNGRIAKLQAEVPERMSKMSMEARSELAKKEVAFRAQNEIESERADVATAAFAKEITEQRVSARNPRAAAVGKVVRDWVPFGFGDDLIEAGGAIQRANTAKGSRSNTRADIMEEVLSEIEANTRPAPRPHLGTTPVNP